MEDFARAKQYEYKQNSNLVLQADPDSRRRGDEATGEVESLVGKLGGTKMGDRVGRARPPELDERLKKMHQDKRAREEKGDVEEKKKKKSRSSTMSSNKGSSVLTETESLTTMHYRPKTRESRLAYEQLLTFVQQSIGDQPQDVLRGAVDELLAILKDPKMREPEKHREAGDLLLGGRSLADDLFNKMTTLGKQITDFSAEGEVEVEGDEDDKIDEELGVAVVFDGEEEEEEGDGAVDEVMSEDDDDVDDEGVDAANEKLLKGGDEDDDGGVGEGEGLSVQDIDAYWLQRGISKFYDDADVSARLAEDVLGILQEPDERACENQLVVLLDYDKFDFIKLLLRNRSKIVYCTRLKQAQTEEERGAIEEEMRSDVAGGGALILEQLSQTTTAASWAADRMGSFASRTRKEARGLAKQDGGDSAVDDEGNMMDGAAAAAQAVRAGRTLDLDGLAFDKGGHTMSNKKCELPEKSWRLQKKGYEEVHVPAVRALPMDDKEKLVPIDELPEWTHAAFSGMSSLNRIQSRLFDSAFHKAGNLLLCAPTGAGKTNVAMLTMLHEIGLHRRADGSIDLDAFKIVYVAPMKALVQECVLNFGKRLESYGITVRELSGDQSLTKQQISETQLIVTTPEKWDIITRKSGDRTYTQLVRLIIIDEIHLLHDDRGPVLESLVARTIRQIESTQEMTRIVGLSATLPNYEDVATFLRVDPADGLFYFDNSFRPVALQQQYIGVTEKKAMKRFQLMNQICYEKVLAQAGKNQVLIFSHSRKETAKTARALRDLALENDTLGQFMKDDQATREILTSEAEQAKSEDLKDLLPYGFAIHHAGMTRTDRNLVEDLFADRHIQVLVSTATLAWGVNLPAHTVIIKGTQIYNPEKGRWVELSPLDVMQMLGRAGRPQYDTQGEGIILTQHSELQYYLSLMNQQLPVESQLVGQLADHMNAEIVRGSVQNIQEAVAWLGYSYLYIRMLRAPATYGISPEEAQQDELLEQRRADLAHSAALTLDRNHLIRYDRKTGSFQPTDLGRVASYYYVSHTSMSTFNEYLKASMSDIELFRLFSLSNEFKYIVVREEEKLELAKLMDRVPIPVKESAEEPSAKVNVLLQAYISRLPLEGFALLADMTYIQQSAARILRALFEITLKRGWAALAEKALGLCKMIDRRMWMSQSPLRQFKGIPEAVLRKLERKDIAWERYYDLKPADLGELVQYPKVGKVLHRAVHQFPRLELEGHVQPITRSLLKVELTITPDFQFDSKVHDFAQTFWVLVEDVDGERVLHHEVFLLKERYSRDPHTLSFTVPVFDPLPPQYFVRVLSDRWLHAETCLPISFRHLILPAKFPPATELLDLQALPVSVLRLPEASELYPFPAFNPVQTQAFPELFETDNNVLLAAPAGSGKTAAAEFALLRLFRGEGAESGGRAVYVAPVEAVCDARFRDWSYKFGKLLGKTVVQLTGDNTADLQLLEVGDLTIATAEQWDQLSRRWKQRKRVQGVALFIVDELHLMGGGGQGPTLEVVVSRMRYISSQVETKMRVVALSASLANGKDVGDWIGAKAHSLFNFHPNVRPVPLEIHIQGFDINDFSGRMVAMSRPMYNAAAFRAAGQPALVFVPSKRQSQLAAIDLLTFAAADGQPTRFLHEPEEGFVASLLDDSDGKPVVRDSALRHTLAHGVGFVHAGLSVAERELVSRLYKEGVLQVLVLTADQCWGLSLSAAVVTIMGTQTFDGREHRYVDYPVTDILQMMGRAGRAGDASARVLILCHAPKRELFKKFLFEPLPLESHLDHVLQDHINAEVVTKTIENKQDAVDYLTWTFLYRRLSQNPNYYNLHGVTHRHLSDFLSELVESTVADLVASQCISVEEEMTLSAVNLGMIASYYYIHYTSLELFSSSLTAKTKTRGLLEIVSNAAEFDSLPVRYNEEQALKALALHQPVHSSTANYSDPHTKVHTLLQAHFSRSPLPADLRKDQSKVVAEVPRLLQAIVDVIGSNAWLKPALAAMELCQMTTQALWDKDSALLQLPHFTREMATRCEAAEVETVFDVMGLEDEKRDELLQLAPAQMADVAKFCNAYPSVDVSFEVQDADEVTAGDVVSVVVSLEREDEDDDDMDTSDAGVGVVVAPRFPKRRHEGWWLVIGDPKTNALLAIKRLTLQRRARAKLDIVAPDAVGKAELTLFLMSDSYLGCDQEYELELDVKEGDESGESEEESEE